MRQDVEQLTLHLRLQLITILLRDLLWSQVDAQINLTFLLEIHRDEVVKSHALPQRLLQMQDVDQVNTIGAFQHENFVDVFEHDLVIMRLTV